MRVLVVTTLLLIGSNIFMTIAWYGHLRWFDHRPWYLAVVAAWGIAFFEYTLQVPANRIGYTKLSLPQLKVLCVSRESVRHNGCRGYWKGSSE